MVGADPLAFQLEDLAQLDDLGLRQRWRRLMGRQMPDGLGRPLALRVLAYQLQARLHGDLDTASRRALTEVLRHSKGSKASAVGVHAVGSPTAVATTAQTSPLLRPGTMLTREHGGILHRVMVMDRGFGWNGRTYDSLSNVAYGITGTRWNGPRFFGLRDKAIAK